ncbi:guanine nucleotide-binding protein-like 1 isoform X2 [Orbicella faveolata]|nr:guanine nucleotide-binding protein-like 1 isoform X2 [Orbicella faveolata]
MPKRPPWKYSMSKEQVERSEREMFENFLDRIYDEYKLSELSYFERNLETWRQLWRVLEVSDIVVLITDIRHPVLHFPPTVHNHVVQDLKKELVLVLNKIDLVPPEVVTAWKQYFKSKFEHLKVVCFTSFPKDENERKKDPSKVLSKRRRRKRGFFPVGPRVLLEACENLRGDRIDLSSWARKLSEQEKGEEEGILYDDYGSSDESEEEEGGSFEDVEHNENILTLGLVGHPNVGKSSLLNGLVGHKVVSTSRTPGHTKHFQTIFLTANVRLCDCPGLVFPSVVGKQLQILSGMYPISQVQEPYTAVGYLAARVLLVDLLQLVHPLNRADSDDEGGAVGDENHPWSAWDVCDAWAHKRGFLTAKAGRTDVYRAANSLLRLAVDGKIVMCVYPPGFISKKAEWQNHPETKEIALLQERHSESRRLRQQENEADEFSSHLLAPPGRGRRSERPSSDGDDEQEGEETDVVSSNPFALLSDE